MAALLCYRGPHSFAQIAKDFEVGVSLSALADIFIPLGAIGFTVATRSRANLCLISLVSQRVYLLIVGTISSSFEQNASRHVE